MSESLFINFGTFQNFLASLLLFGTFWFLLIPFGTNVPGLHSSMQLFSRNGAYSTPYIQSTKSLSGSLLVANWQWFSLFSICENNAGCVFHHLHNATIAV